MSIPDYQTVMLPLLQALSDGNEWFLRDATEAVIAVFSLTEEEQAELLPSGKQRIIHNRVAWAKTYLAKAALLESTRRGYFRITNRGQDVLASSPERIDVAYLGRFEEFAQFREKKNVPSVEARAPIEPTVETPDEAIRTSVEEIHAELRDSLLVQVKSMSPAFFEKLVIDLMVAMGYGGSQEDAGEAVGGSGDGGIDGVIKEDRLGLDAIYLQAKRWAENAVGRPDIQKFVGALHGRRAMKGVFITTSRFSKEALDYVETIDTKIVLIDGDQLTKLMTDFEVGTSIVETFQLRKIDMDYFMEE